jgi:AhpD family alkylhydroperoxidase
MDSKTKELIAIGASITANCIPCLDFHITKAREYGATEKELIIASKIGQHVKNGAAKKVSEHAAKQLSQFHEEQVDDVCQCD